MPSLLDRLELHHADVRDVLPGLAENSVDAVLADPPYGVRATKWAGQGTDWDRADALAFDPAFWTEIRRVVRPGGTVLSFGHARTVHRIATAIEDAGFQIVDQLTWAKSHSGLAGNRKLGPDLRRSGAGEDLADEYEGWHSGLRGSTEPIVVARNLQPGQTLAQAIAEGGTGGWNVDRARIPDDGENRARLAGRADRRHLVRFAREVGWSEPHEGGRHPTNLLLAHGPGCAMDECETECPAAGIDRAGRQKYAKGRERASRFFSKVQYSARSDSGGHPTAKPVAVAEWLASLVVRPGFSTVLDPFAGGGSLAFAAARTGAVRVIAVEREAEYVAMIREKFRTTG